MAGRARRPQPDPPDPATHQRSADPPPPEKGVTRDALTLTVIMIAELGLGQLSDLLPERVIGTFNDHRAKDKDEVLAVMGKTRLHCQRAGD